VCILNEHIELLLLLIVEHGKCYEQEERGGNVLHGAMMGLLCDPAVQALSTTHRQTTRQTTYSNE